MDSLPVPEEILVDIFLRIPEPADLVRASASCVSFRRLVADRCFLRQYRKLHAPPVLGFRHLDRKFHPAVPPHPSAPAARAVALAADFSFSFLPAPAGKWVVQDLRDGRVVLDRTSGNANGKPFMEFVVCDPLYRLFLLLPPIPDELTAMVEHPRFFETFLIRPAGDEAAAAEETSFRVMWVVQCNAKLVAFVFSSNTGLWRALPPQSWSSLFAVQHWTHGSLFSFRRHVYDCIYWMPQTPVEKKMLVLDTQRMEFSIAEPPVEAKDTFVLAITMAETKEGRPGIFVLSDGSSESELSYSIRQHDGGTSSQWKKKKTISLGSKYILKDSTERYLFMYRQLPLLESGFYTLDVKTFQLHKLCDVITGIAWWHAYSNYPPSLLSSPTISSGVENEAEVKLEAWNKAALQAQVHDNTGQNSADANAGGQDAALMIRDGAEAAAQPRQSTKKFARFCCIRFGQQNGDPEG